MANMQIGDQPPTINHQQSTPSPFPWLKYAEIFLALLVIVNLGLFGLYFFSKQKSLFSNPQKFDEHGFLLTKTDQKVSKERYSIKFSNPRYESDGVQNFFRLDIEITNKGYINPMSVIVNCDIMENGAIVGESVGVSYDTGEIVDVPNGSTVTKTATLILGNKTQKVSSCLFSPEGVFDPNLTIKVIF